MHRRRSVLVVGGSRVGGSWDERETYGVALAQRLNVEKGDDVR